MPQSTKTILWIVAAVALVLFSGALQYALPIVVFGAPLALGALIGPRVFNVEKKWALINGLLIGLLVDVAIGIFWLFKLVNML